jgi:hypothetical protein
VQRAIAHLKTGIFRGYGVAEAPPVLQAGLSYYMNFFIFFLLFYWLAHLEFPCKFLHLGGYIAVSELSLDALS